MDVSIATLGVPRQKIIQQIATFESYNDFLSAGMEARQHRDNASWILGCLAVGVEKKYGEDAVGKFAKEVGVSTASLGVYRWVVKKFLETDPNFVPPEYVAFGVLEASARLSSPEERMKMIEDAANNGMSVERARVEVKKKNGGEVIPKPKYKIIYCEAHGKAVFCPDNINEWEAMHDGL